MTPRHPAPARVPTLTEVIEPSTGNGGQGLSAPAASSQASRDMTPPHAPHAPRSLATDAALVDRIVDELERRIERKLKVQLDAALAQALAPLLRQLTSAAMVDVQAGLREAVVAALADDAALSRAAMPRTD